MKEKESNSAQLISDLRGYLQKLLLESKSGPLSPRSRLKLEVEIREVMAQLGKFLSELDPIMQPTSIFDPSNPKTVGRFVSLALVAQGRQSMSDIPRFYGSGVYAIYYNGSFPEYGPISQSETPIYVGQAAPAVRNARTASEQGDKLSSRLIEHRKNICKATSSLSIDDFEFRVLVVQSGWETPSEDYLIHLFHPIWNNETQLVFGIGKHGDAAKTRANRRSPWDTMHPGRTWAADPILADAKDVKRIKLELKDHFEKYPVFRNLDSLLLSFIEELKQI